MLDKKTVIGAIIGIVVAVTISMMAPPEGLSAKAMICLGIFMCAIVFWILGVMPDYITAILMICMWVAFGVVKFNTAFSSFAGSTFWMIVLVLALAASIAKSGLLTRIALFLMSLFPLSYKAQSMGLMITSAILAPLIPSSSAKVSLLAPLSVTISKEMGFQKFSNGMTGLFLSVYVITQAMQLAFLSSSFFNYVPLGFLPEPYKNVSWLEWFVNASVWFVVCGILVYLAIQFLYKPEKTDVTISKNFINERRAALGKMSRDEKIVSVVVAICFCLWVTESIHRIPTAIVTGGGVAALAFLRVMTTDDWRHGVQWDVVFFLGGLVSLGSVFPAVGIDKWIVSILGPILEPLMSNVPLFIIVFCCVIYAVRLVIVSQTAVCTIFIVALAPTAIEAGMNPWIVCAILLSSVKTWNVTYQTTDYVVGTGAANTATGEKVLSHMMLVKMSIAFMIINIIGFLASIPLWKMTGYL